MNPTDLQRRLDAVAVPPEDASAAQWTRNRELVVARRRRRRVGGASLAGVAAAAAVAVALTWTPPGNSVRVEPAAPAVREDPAARVRAADPTSLAGTAQQCAQSLQRTGVPTALAGGTSDLVNGVLYRFDDGETRFCADFHGVIVDGSVTGDGAAGRQGFFGGTGADEDGSYVAALFGQQSSPYDRVVVSTPDGQEFEAMLLDGYWWTAVVVPLESQLDETTWTAFDAQGRLVDQGRVGSRG